MNALKLYFKDKDSMEEFAEQIRADMAQMGKDCPITNVEYV